MAGKANLSVAFSFEMATASTGEWECSQVVIQYRSENNCNMTFGLREGISYCYEGMEGVQGSGNYIYKNIFLSDLVFSALTKLPAAVFLIPFIFIITCRIASFK